MPILREGLELQRWIRWSLFLKTLSLRRGETYEQVNDNLKWNGSVCKAPTEKRIVPGDVPAL